MAYKRITKFAISIILSVSMILELAGIVPIYTKAAIDNTKAAEPEAGQETVSPFSANAEITNSSTDKQEIAELLLQKKFTVSDNKTSMEYYKKGNGVLIKGSRDGINGSTFTFEEEIDFGTQSPGYIVVDGLACKKEKLSLQFYLDNDKKAFASVNLNAQKRKDYWNLVKNVCQNVKNRNITGKHKISFKVTADNMFSGKFLLRSIFFTNNDIPILDFNIDESEGSIGEMNGDTSHNTECYGNMSLEVPDGYKSEYSSKKMASGTYDLEYIRGRGNSTWYADKKPYKFKLKTSTDFFGMGKNKHWILLANYYDGSMIRNKITYWLGAEMGMKYTPQCVFVDVIMNNQYAGSYYLCEQIRVGKNRVNIDDLEADEAAKNVTTGAAITGGYLLSLSPYTESDNMKEVFATERGNTFAIQSPGFDDYFNEAQYNYISDYVQKTEDAIYSKDYKDLNGKHYGEYMDIDAAIDYYWVQEISSNGDAYNSSSTYLYKKRNGKLFWGPLWDFDYVAWGDTDKNTKNFSKTNSTWFGRLMQDKLFVEKLIKRWPAFKEKLLYACKDGGQIDQYAAQLYNSQKANYNVIGIFAGAGGWSGDILADNGIYVLAGEDIPEFKSSATFDSEVERLKKWISDRVEWIDANVNTLYPVTYNLTYMSDGEIYKKDTYLKNSNYGITFPEPPEKNGYIFKGWYYKNVIDGKEYESPVTENISISSDTTLYAKWLDKSKAVKATGISFAQDEICYYMFDSIPLIPVYVIPFNAEVPEVTYTSSDESVVSIHFNEYNNKIEILTMKKGDATITATTKDGLSAKCLVHIIGYDEVKFPQSAEFSLKEKDITLKKGSYSRIIPEYGNPRMPGLSYIFDTSDESLVEINPAGYIYAKKTGTAYIGVKCSLSDRIRFCKVTVTGKDTDKNKNKDVKKDKNKNIKFTFGGLVYKTTKTDAKTVICTDVSNKSIENIKIPGKVVYKGISYKVTEIGKSVFEGCQKLKKVVIGKNIKIIGDKAFYKCKLLKLLDIKSGKLKKAGKNVIGETAEDLEIKAPAGKYNKYLKLFKKL